MTGRAITVWMKACAAAAVLTGAACSARMPYPAARSPDADPVEEADSLAAARPIEETLDSLNAAEHGSLEGELLDALDDGAPAAQANESIVEAAPLGRARGDHLACELSAIAGHRTDVRARFGGWHGLSGGFRAGESASAGYARVGGRGVLEGLHVGRFTLRAGERVVLGRGIGSYAASGSGTVRGGFAVSPSLSRWFGEDGGALALEWNRWRCHAVAVTREEERWSHPQSLWMTVVKHWAWGAAGVTVGEPLAPGASESTIDPDESAASAVARGSALSCHAAFRRDGFAGSFEVAQLSHQVFFAARASERRPSNRCRWAVLLFRVPYAALNGASGLEAVTKTDQGVRLDLSSRAGGVGASAVLIAGRTWSPSRIRAYRRLVAALEGAVRPARWEVSAQARSEVESVYPSGAIGREIPSRESRDLRLRAAVGMGGARGLGASARVEYLPAIDGVASGLILSVATDLAGGPIEGRVQLSAHALPHGRLAFASRPGIGPFETLAPLSGRGSDLSVRVRARIGGGAALTAFYGSEWLEADRLYIGAEYRR